MASVTVPAIALTANTDVSSYTTASFTPATDDLVAAFVAVSNQQDTDWVLSDSVGGSYTKIIRAVQSTVDMLELWVGDQFSDGSAQTLTFAHAGGVATGCRHVPLLIAGMSRVGSSAVRAKGNQDSGTAATTPTIVLDDTPLAGNACVSSVCNSANPAGMTQPASWASLADTGHIGPNRGVSSASVDSGFTDGTVTWGSVSSAAYQAVAAELDTSAAESAVPTFTRSLAG